ncbi:helicase associated domain-containing protein [Streptomyces sp. NPDC002952]|uniref:helicase associated domain-containing protein n=1 Tax=Streptomyces sp. NPDC002952 TaxID=3364673 RepID=UPI0036CAE468
MDWQRHYRVLADLVDADGVLPAIEPGVLFEGDDLGKWLERQKNPGTWTQLSSEQQERLSALDVQPAETPSPAPAAARATKDTRARRSRRSSAAWLPRTVGRAGRRPPAGTTCPQRRDRRRRRGGAGDRETGGMGFEHQIEARQACPGAAGRAAGARHAVGVSAADWEACPPDHGRDNPRRTA